jgi:glycosyltransferase involved in cell wall biosynthesis
MLLMQRAGMPIIANVHHPITVDKQLDLAATKQWRKKPSKYRWYGFLKMQKRVIQRMPTLVTVSENSFVDIVRDFEVDAAKMRVIPVGVEHEVFVPPTAPRVRGRIVATASADHPLKGVVPLLEAAAKLRTERDIEVVIVGKASEGGAAAKTIERLGLEDTVRFMTGLPEKELVDIFGSANVGVVPSLYEGFSIPAVEAMACATPLIATTGGALPEVCGTDGKTAVLVSPGDPAELADALDALLSDDARRKKIGVAGRKRIETSYTWRRVAESMVEVYREAIERDRAAKATS